MACGLSIDIMTFDLAWPWKVKSRSRNFWSQISRKWCKIRGWSQWRSDRKSHMGYRLVSSLLAYRDLERSSQGHVVFKTKYLANGTRHGVGVNGRRLSIDWRHSHWITVILNGQKSICHHQINYHYTALVRSAISALAEFLLLYLKRRFVITLTGIL